MSSRKMMDFGLEWFEFKKKSGVRWFNQSLLVENGMVLKFITSDWEYDDSIMAINDMK